MLPSSGQKSQSNSIRNCNPLAAKDLPMSTSIRDVGQTSRLAQYLDLCPPSLGSLVTLASALRS